MKYKYKIQYKKYINFGGFNNIQNPEITDNGALNLAIIASQQNTNSSNTNSSNTNSSNTNSSNTNSSNTNSSNTNSSNTNSSNIRSDKLGITSSTNSINNSEIVEFIKYPIIKSKTEDNLFEGDGARGDGYCSIWSILIGWSLRNRNKLIINEQFLADTNQPTNMSDLVNIIINTAKTLNNFMGENATLEIEGFTFSKGELEILIFQLELPQSEVQTIEGRAQFQILALLLGVEIKVHDETTNIIYTIGNPENDTIRVSTNGNHYHVRNNRQDTNLDHFTNRYWWNLQWQDHPHIPEGKSVIAYIP